MEQRKTNAAKVITGRETRFTNCAVYEPRSFHGSVPKYGVTLLVPKTDTETVDKMQMAMEAAFREGAELLSGGNEGEPMKNPIRDGDAERPENSAYAGMWFVNAYSGHAPGIVGPDCLPLAAGEEFYSGCYGRASVTFYAFNRDGNRGIACRLNNLQKLRDGEELSSWMSAEEEFAGIE